METPRHEAHVEAKTPTGSRVLTPVNAHHCPGAHMARGLVGAADTPPHTHLSEISQCLALGQASRWVGQGPSHGRALLPPPPGLLGGQPGRRFLVPRTQAAG